MREKELAALIHLLGPLTLGIAALLIWLFNKEKSDFIDFHGKAFLNYFINIVPLLFLTLLFSYSMLGRLFFYLILIYGLLFGLISIIKCHQGEYYEYPFTIRVIKR